MTVITLKMTLYFLTKRIARWKKNAKAILFTIMFTIVALSGTWKIITGNLNYFLVILELQCQQ
jgi:hypothetical protein